jgi:fumarate reductase flavoprotein subunit
MSSEEKNSNQHLQADLVIIGGGGGGLAAAVASAELGAHVIILEKRRTVGGNATFAEGFFAAESPAQKRNNIDADRDKLFRIGMEYSHWTLDARILRSFIDKSGDTVRWLEEKGLKCDWIPGLYPNQVPLVWHCFKQRGAVVVKLLREHCDQLGVQVMCSTPAQKILADRRGRVTGVLATAGDQPVQIDTGHIIISTGGYAGNKEMLKQYALEYTEDMGCGGIPHNGDGIRMAWEVGADSDGLGILQLVGPGFPGPERLSSVACEPNTVWINKYGQRFTDETTAYNIFESANTLLRQPNRVCYSLFDEQIKQAIIDNGIAKGAGIVIIPPMSPYPELGHDLEQQAAKGQLMIAGSWEEIAGWIGCDPMVLQTEIDTYNTGCDRGHDDLFAKDRRFLQVLRTPPYYAIKCSLGFLGTIGGIKINSRMEVIDRAGDPIPGLYAAGVDTGGWESETYCGVLAGTCFGFALNSGRIAAENAVRSFKSGSTADG